MHRLFIYLLVGLFFSFSAFSQRFLYCDREIHYDENREQVKIISASDDFLHVWKYGLSGVSVSVYTKNLEYLSTKKLSSRLGIVSFIRSANFYYAVLSDSANTEIYSIEKDGRYAEKTKVFEKQKLTLGVRHTYSFRQGITIIFLLQQINDIDLQKSFLHLTALDTNLNYINRMVLEVEYIRGQPQNLILSAFGNQLLLLNETISNGTAALAITKIDVAKNTFLTKFLHPEGLQFISHQLLFYGNEIILKSQVREMQQKEERPKTFTYFIKMDSELQVTKDLYLNSPNLPQLHDSVYFYRPFSTVVLPGKQLLTVDFGRKEDNKLPGSEGMLRFLWIDSSFNIVKMFNQPSGKDKYSPWFQFFNEKRHYFYYEEMINNRNKMISSYEIEDSLVNETPLLLTPAYWYILGRSIPVNESSFVMPYTHNFHLGLVKINVDNN